MNDELNKESVDRLVREIRVAAILREAGRLAPQSASKNGPIYQAQIAQAVKAYKEVSDEMKKLGL